VQGANIAKNWVTKDVSDAAIYKALVKYASNTLKYITNGIYKFPQEFFEPSSTFVNFEKWNEIDKDHIITADIKYYVTGMTVSTVFGSFPNNFLDMLIMIHNE